MPEDTVLFLDFDGVICDSYVECFSMAWYAYHRLYLHDDADTMNIADKARFRQLRPMVRNSEDNVVIQHIMHKGVEIKCQEDFDRTCSSLGQEVLNEMRRCFYETRDFFLGDYQDFWLDLNVIFPALIEPLKKTSANPAVYILSTKKPAFIDEILKHNGIEWEYPRILEAHGRSKEDIILDVIDAAGFSKAVFVDDQIDHLRSDGGGRITNYLAEWGYVSDDGKKDFSVPHMNLEECARFTGGYAV